MKKYLSIFFFSFLSFGAFASHIVGGEILYDYLGNNQYRITLKIYRDCNVLSPFDGTGDPALPAFITVFDGFNNLIDVYDIGPPTITPVPPAFNNPCIQTPTGSCVEEGLYITILTLPPLTGGYTIVYQRCCRNAGVANLVNSENEGSSYYTKIPGPEHAIINSSPRFTRFPPIYICNSVNFKFDHSATDPDGDQLVYSLCPPYTGLDGCCPSLGASAPAQSGNCMSPPLSCPTAAPPPPYANVLFASPYSGTYPIASNPAFSINPSTGQLSGTPTLIAQYVVGVCIQEYRNNTLLNTHFRDFQFTVVGCTVNVQSAVADQTTRCEGQSIVFNNQSINNSATPVYHWDFGVPALANDTSNIINPSYMYPDTGTFMITLITNPGKTCADTLVKPVYVYPPLKINYTRPDRQCFKNNSFDFKTQGAYILQTAYQWDFTANATPSVSTLKDPAGIHFLDDGLFLVKLKASQFACRDSFTDTIKVMSRPQAKISNVQNDLCDPAAISFSNSSSSELPVRYKWSFSNGKTSTEFAPTQLFTPAGKYSATLIVETTELCVDTSVAVIATINVNPKPTAAFTFTPREVSIFEPYISISTTSPDFPLTAAFDFGDGQSSSSLQNIHTYSNYGNFLITQTVINRFGCADTTSDVVKILPEFRFWMPNTFTPDDNQRNDVFMPVSIGLLKYEFEVYDRWGEKIYRTTNSSEGWNGKYKGVMCQQGVYAWKVNFVNAETQKEETRAGLITLIRNQ